MPKVKLSVIECDRDLLPRVCARCGRPSDHLVRRKFQWFPPLAYIGLVAGLLPFAIVAMLMTKRMEARMPMCDEHKRDWVWRQWVVIGGLVLLFTSGIVAFAIAVSQQERPGDSEAAGMVCAGFGFALLIFLIPAAIINNKAIRPTEITDRGMTLINVHRDFVDALADDRDRDREEYERQRQSRRERKRQQAGSDDRPPEEWPRPKQRTGDDDLDRRASD